ncbi:MAG: exonuclease SbcCD subunit D [Anaerolineae bacterium]|nr:exonuclease SbcCD subunit D [Anaerolineae bacterium]
MRFLHAADVHLGYQQYNSKERFNDFYLAFRHLADEAKAHQASFLLLGGDLFEKRTVDPLAMRQAVDGLQALKDAGIPVIAVEGNHERAHYRDQYSWLQFLDAIGLITLLDPLVQDGQMLLEPYDAESGGAYVDLPGGIRVYGLKYYGAVTGRALGLLQQALAEAPPPRPAYSILLTHAGLEGVLPRCSGAVPRQALEPLREHIDYVALGHIHKPYEFDRWIYNPGSLETWSVEEAAWEDRGYYVVELSAHSPLTHEARLVPTPRRRFERVRLSVDACASPQAVYDAVRARLRRVRPASDATQAPVVELTLEGTLSFDRLELDLGQVEALAREAFEPLLVRVRNATVPSEFQINLRQASSRAELEHLVLRELVERDARYRPHSAAWAEVALELKHMALEDNSAEAILDHLRRRQREIQQEGP